MTKLINKYRLMRIFVSLVLVLALFSTSLLAFAVDKLDSISSRFSLDDYYRLDVIDNQKIQVSGITNLENTGFMIHINDHMDDTGITGTVDQSTGKYSGIVDLSELAPDTYFIYLFFNYSGYLIPYPIVKTETEIFIPTGEYYRSNDTFSRMLSALNPNDYVSTEGLYDTYEHYIEIKQKAEEIVEGATSDYEKILLIHDWVAGNIHYDWVGFLDGSWLIDYEKKQSPYYVFEHKYAVCQGYSLLAQLMLRSVGVPCLWFSGYAEGVGALPTDDKNESNHAWNAAFANGRWVVFDATWNSSNKREYDENNIIVLNKGDIRHTYFDPSIEAFSYDHRLLDLDTITAGDFELDFIDGEFWVTGYTGTGSVAVVPYSFGGIPVTRICDSVFDDHTLIKSYDKNGSIIAVEPGPLKKIVIPSSIQTIEKHAFTRIYINGSLYPIETQIVATATSAAAEFATEHEMNYVEAEQVEEFTLNKSEIFLATGEHSFLNITTPGNSVFSTLTFTSSNPEVAKVTDYGVVIAKSSGTAQISVTADGITKTCSVTVMMSNSEAVNHKIIALPEIDEITIDHAEIIFDAKSSYDALSNEEKALIVNSQKLFAALDRINELIEQEQEQPEEPEEPEYLPGDIDGDGNLTVVDIVALRSYIMGNKILNDWQILAANVDGSGGITVTDIVALRKIIMNA